MEMLFQQDQWPSILVWRMSQLLLCFMLQLKVLARKNSTLTFFVHKLLGNGNFKIAQLKTDYLVKCDSPSDANKLDGKVKVFKRSIVGFRKLKTVVIPASMSCREDALVLSDARPDQ